MIDPREGTPAWRLLELLLRLYPEDLHTRYAREMRETLHLQLLEARARGRAEAARVWTVTLIGVAVAGLTARLRGVADGVAYDLRHALGHAARHRLASTATIVTLALSIGIVAAVFSLVRQVLVEPLPYREPERLAALWTVDGIGEAPQPVLSAPDFLAVQRGTRVFEDVAGAVGFTASLAGGGADAEEVRTAMVSWNFFALLGVEPVRGRLFAAEEQGAVTRRALITHDLWMGRYGGDPEIVGRAIVMNGSEIVVVGVLPPDWVFYVPDGSGASIAATRDLRVWEVFRFDVEGFARDQRFFTTVGRLREGVAWSEVAAEMAAHSEALQRAVSEYDDRGTAIIGTPLKDAVVQGSATALWALAVASVLVLLVAGVNLLTLSHARLAARAREFRVRAALGARRVRLVRQRWIESAVLAAAGGAGGALVAGLLLDLVRGVGPEAVPRLDAVRVDVGVLAFSVGIGVVLALLFGGAPTQVDPHAPAALGDRGSTAGAGRLRGATIAAGPYGPSSISETRQGHPMLEPVEVPYEVAWEDAGSGSARIRATNSPSSTESTTWIRSRSSLSRQ